MVSGLVVMVCEFGHEVVKMILTEGDGMVEAFRLDRLDSIWFVPGLRTNRQRVACSSAKSCRDYEATSARNSAGLRHRTVLPRQCYRTVLPHNVTAQCRFHRRE